MEATKHTSSAAVQFCFAHLYSKHHIPCTSSLLLMYQRSFVIIRIKVRHSLNLCGPLYRSQHHKALPNRRQALPHRHRSPARRIRTRRYRRRFKQPISTATLTRKTTRTRGILKTRTSSPTRKPLMKHGNFTRHLERRRVISARKRRQKEGLRRASFCVLS